jgi:hypothetical protein
MFRLRVEKEKESKTIEGISHIVAIVRWFLTLNNMESDHTLKIPESRTRKFVWKTKVFFMEAMTPIANSHTDSLSTPRSHLIPDAGWRKQSQLYAL